MTHCGDAKVKVKSKVKTKVKTERPPGPESSRMPGGLG